MTTITVRNKIGFHTGPAGNRTGINRGGFMERLTQARIPFMLKSVDDYGPCFEAVEHIQKSGVPHMVVFRLSSSGQGTGYTFDIPRYDDYPNDPYAGAVKHWEKTMERLPRDFNKEYVWLELINEVDRNRCDWLGHFATHCASFALRDGYKITMFGWSSGEPEKSGWSNPACWPIFACAPNTLTAWPFPCMSTATPKKISRTVFLTNWAGSRSCLRFVMRMLLLGPESISPNGVGNIAMYRRQSGRWTIFVGPINYMPLILKYREPLSGIWASGGVWRHS